MGEFENEKIKNSFLKVKQDIDSLKTQISEVKALIEDFQKKLKSPDQTLTFSKNSLNTPQETSSTGNQGVYADMHADMQTCIHSFNRHSTDMQTYKQTNSTLTFSKIKEPSKNWASFDLPQIDSLFLSLTKGEFLVFLTIYQTEEDIKRGVSYLELSRHFSLSEGCIRTYISQLLKKQAPITKIRLNNKLTLLSIDKDFRSLNLKTRLIAIISHTNPDQTKL
ncbi:hypothetical protein HYX16_05445 [Candidatus Woesearchaeota archaeon]|nr:hypothetical protein [Candidatus Woesearchaeota archaeon]